jgi:hypothetical protein
MLYPILAMVVLTAMVWGRLYVTRVRKVRTKRIPVQELADRSRASRLLQDVAGPSDNLINLFELPVLFYVAMILLYVTGHGDGVYLAMAWIYVSLRAAHSFIHCTYNRVMHRFGVYLLSSVVLWAMWARLGWQFLAAA